MTSSVQLEVTQGLAREAVVALPAGLVVNQVAGAAVADWNVAGTTLTVTFLEPIAGADLGRDQRGGSRAARRTDHDPARPRAVGRARDGRRRRRRRGRRRDRRPRAARPRAGRRVGSRRHRRRPRIAVDGRVPVHAAQRQRAAIADRQRVALHRAGRARRQRRGGALRRAARRGRQAARPRALRRPQQPAQLPRGHAAAAIHAVERRRWPASRSARAWRPTAGCCCRCARGARTKRRRRSSSSCCTCSAGRAGRSKGDAHARAPGGRSAGVAHRPDAAPLAALRRDPQPGAFRPETDPGPWSAALRGATAAASGAAAAAAGAAQPASATRRTSRRSWIASRRKRAAPGRASIPIAITFPAIGPSRVSRRRADAGDAVARRSTFLYRKTFAGRRPLMSRMLLLSFAAVVLVDLPSSALAQERRAAAGRGRHRHDVAHRIRPAARSRGRKPRRSSIPRRPRR